MCYFRPVVTTSAGSVKYPQQHNVQNVLACAVTLYPDAACVCVCGNEQKYIMCLYVSLFFEWNISFLHVQIYCFKT